MGRDKTVLLSTHILQEVEAMADRILMISEGRLVFDGTTADLLHAGGLFTRTAFQPPVDDRLRGA